VALDPEWLTSALAPRFPGVRVVAVEPGPVISRLSTNARFAISCEGGLPDGLSPDLCAKGYFTDDDGASWFVDDLTNVPPFDHNGKKAVRIKMFMAANGQKFIGWLEQYDDATKKRIDARLQANPNDASAHYLLGTLYFSRGLTDSALTEWAQAGKLNPAIPVLDASVGLALLHEKNDFEGALSAFRRGLSSDPSNIMTYVGTDQALSLLGKTSGERVQALERYPNLAEAPPGLIFELILNLSEAGEYERANGLFRNRFFPREEGGTNVRQVWVEVQLQKALALAKAGNCTDALAEAGHLGASVPEISFTHDGLEPILKSARTSDFLGAVYASCGKSEEAISKFQLAASASAPDQVRWAWLAAQKLPGFDEPQWQERLRSALLQAESRSETSAYPSWWDYTAGALQLALGNRQQAEQSFRKALLLPDRMLAYHFTRLARSAAAP